MSISESLKVKRASGVASAGENDEEIEGEMKAKKLSIEEKPAQEICIQMSASAAISGDCIRV